jgi:hypothetical protein
LALEQAERIELTLIDHDFDGDVLFPEIDPAEWSAPPMTPQSGSPEEAQRIPGDFQLPGYSKHNLENDKRRKTQVLRL